MRRIAAPMLPIALSENDLRPPARDRQDHQGHLRRQSQAVLPAEVPARALRAAGRLGVWRELLLRLRPPAHAACFDEAIRDGRARGVQVRAGLRARMPALPVFNSLTWLRGRPRISEC